MYIFIDEAGGFQVTNRPNAVSCVSGFVVPEPLVRTLFRRFRRTISPFRAHGKELKGSQLSEEQMDSIIRTVRRFDVLLLSVAIDMSLHSDAAITAHKDSQAEKLIAGIVPRMNEQLRNDLNRWSNQVRTLLNQLYVQSVLLTELVHSILHLATLYYVQRLPRALGAFWWRLRDPD